MPLLQEKPATRPGGTRNLKKRKKMNSQTKLTNETRVTHVDPDTLTRHLATVLSVDETSAHLAFDDGEEGWERLETLEEPLVYDLPNSEFELGGKFDEVFRAAGHASGRSAANDLNLWDKTVSEALASANA